jgi:hypothetical protein
MPDIANGMLGMQCYQFIRLSEGIFGYSKMIEQHAFLSQDARRLMRMPGIGQITASAIVAAIGDAKQFRTGRDLAAWLGLTLLNKSSGGMERLGKITKKSDRYICKLVAVGMMSPVVMRKTFPRKGQPLDSQNHCRQAVPIGDNGYGQQSSPYHLGDTHKKTGISVASVLTAPTAKRCKTLK